MELVDSQVNFFFAAVLLALGLYCIIRKTNLIKIIIGLEIMAKAALLSFIAAGGGHVQSVIMIVIAIDAIVAAVALSIVVNAWRHNKNLSIQGLTRLRG